MENVAPKLFKMTATHYQVSLMGSGYGNIYKDAAGKWFGDVRWIGGDLRAQFGKAATRKAIENKIVAVLKG